MHHIKSDIGETFTFDVCDHLKRPCNGVSGGAACLLRQDKSEVLLARESTLQLINGRLHFNFSGGDACRNGKNYSLDIILMCSYAPEPEPMSVVPYSDDQCNYFIFWRTKHACAPLPERLRANECAVRDPSGHVFNLLPLSQLNHRVPDRNGSHFSVTACKPVHYGHMTMCPIGSSVCHVNDSESDYTKKYHDYGQTDANPTIEDGKLVMNLASAEDKCQNSKIFFECDEAATDFGPEYLGKEGCTHLFTWRTSLACKKREFCAVVDPNSGFVFNMSSLAGKQIKLVEANRTYEFAICKTSDTQCPGELIWVPLLFSKLISKYISRIVRDLLGQFPNSFTGEHQRRSPVQHYRCAIPALRIRRRLQPVEQRPLVNQDRIHLRNGQGPDHPSAEGGREHRM